MNDTPSEPRAESSKGTIPATGPSGFPLGPGWAPVRIGDYLVVEQIGSGGMGTVYAAEDVKLRRRVAIKAMRRELAAEAAGRERFEREARAAAAVEHENIVPILHVGEAPDGTPYIVMPFLKGESLDDRLKRDPAVPVPLLLKVAREVAEGLAAAHAAGLIHRDIKPANVWLDGDPGRAARRCRILDFGLARQAGADEIQITARGAVLGTPAYMAPEQARGEKVDHRADLFSLGVMLYRATTGRLPFTGSSPMAVLIALTTETPPPVGTVAPHLPPALARLIDRLMSKDPAARPQSAAEVADAVGRIEADLSAVRAPAPPVEVSELPDLPTSGYSASEPQLLPVSMADVDTAADEPAPFERPRPARRPWVLAAAAALLALGGLGVWLATRDRGDAPAPEVTKKDEPPKAADPDRAAVEYILSVGSAAFINAEPREYRTLAELPGEPFRVTYVDLAGNRKVDDAGLANFRDCKHLTELYLMDTSVTTAGLAHIKGCPALERLGLDGTQVSDAAVAHLKECHGLTRLTLSRTQVSEGGVAELRKALPRCDVQWQNEPPSTDPDRAAALYALSLGGCVSVNDDEREIGRAEVLPKTAFRLTRVVLNEKEQVTDAALSVFRGCKHLFSVGLSYTKTGDAGIGHLKDCKGLHYLYLRNTLVTSAGLAAIRDCTDLQELNLSNTGIDDSALPVLARFTKLNFLYLKDTKVTDGGVKELAKSLRGCAIEWNGGTIKPDGGNAADPERAAANWVWSVGGVVYVNEKQAERAAAADLPPERFRLTGVNLWAHQTLADADLVRLKGCKRLTYLNLSLTKVTDDGLAHLNGIAGLTDLNLSGTPITDAGAANFRNCTELVYLHLSQTKITDAALAHFQHNTKLTHVNLRYTQVGDAGAARVRQWTRLEKLDLIGTLVTAEGVTAFARLLPLCEISWNGGVIAPAADADRTAAEWVLAAKGIVYVDGDSAEIKAAKDLPQTPFRLTAVFLTDPVKGADFARFAGCKNLITLFLSGTEVTDEGLAHFKECTSLATLNLTGTKVTDGCLATLKRFTKLTDLAVGETKVSGAGVKELAKDLPGCTIQWTGGTIRPTKK